MERTKRISGSANVRVGRRRTTSGKGRRTREKERRERRGGRRGRRREEDGSLAPPRPYETSTKGDLRGLAVFGFTSFLYSRDRPAGRIRERRPGMGIAWSLTSYYYTPYMAIRHTSRRRIARSWRETGLGLSQDSTTSFTSKTRVRG